MNLKKLIEILETCDHTKTVQGFGKPHSYRGDYDELAFEPMETTIGEMLDCANFAVGESFTGYKGGTFEMDDNTMVYLAYYGCTGQEITNTVLADMIWGESK